MYDKDFNRLPEQFIAPSVSGESTLSQRVNVRVVTWITLYTQRAEYISVYLHNERAWSSSHSSVGNDGFISAEVPGLSLVTQITSTGMYRRVNAMSRLNMRLLGGMKVSLTQYSSLPSLAPPDESTWTHPYRWAASPGPKQALIGVSEVWQRAPLPPPPPPPLLGHTEGHCRRHTEPGPFLLTSQAQRSQVTNYLLSHWNLDLDSQTKLISYLLTSRLVNHIAMHEEIGWVWYCNLLPFDAPRTIYSKWWQCWNKYGVFCHLSNKL